MQTRTFDLLTQPLNPGEQCTTGASISWAGVRNFVVTPAPEIVDLFDVAKWSLDGDGNFAVVVTCKGERIARFAGMVTCDTDEKDAQTPREYAWGPLVQS